MEQNVGMLSARPEGLTLDARRVESGDGFLRSCAPARGSGPCGSIVSFPAKSGVPRKTVNFVHF